MSNQIEEIFVAIKYGRIDEYKKLIESVDLNILNDSNMNMLQMAVIRKRDECVDDLLKRKIDLNNRDYRGEAALHYAAAKKDVVVMKKLIERGADVNILDNYGNNPLWVAVFYAKGDYEAVKLLLKKDANPVNKNKNDKSALDFAKQINDNELLKMLSECL